MSVASVRALITAAAVEAQGAVGALTEATDPHILAALEHLNEVFEKLGNAYGGLENAASTIAAANEEGSDDLAGVWVVYNRQMEEILTVQGQIDAARRIVRTCAGGVEAIKNETLAGIEMGAEYADRL